MIPFPGQSKEMMNVPRPSVNAACLSEVLITGRIPEKARMSRNGVLRTLTITQRVIRLKLATIK